MFAPKNAKTMHFHTCKRLPLRMRKHNKYPCKCLPVEIPKQHIFIQVNAFAPKNTKLKKTTIHVNACPKEYKS